ncbi:alpha/beta fold hydrolase [Nocardia amikacinitolerans]|uniref:alpha/beta fold hydrolase n=1 Tax=Nocardia amikacinitolerans TaxID=756689 RepID=UPI0020A3D434|nr:alpha/beta hydrolase [Nocardia amikacinitolerans]MCP2291602.1 Pimeloyl-ACP methyl ester carboxylesterase [Nocardia amikacinitolerans]
METVTSADGTTIAFDRIGDGTAGTVILIGGAFGYRTFPKMVQLSEALAEKYGLTVINYDRRGRGDSGDSPGVYDVTNEIEDIAALVQAAGGSAALFGWSSGAVLALLAAGSGRVPGVTKVVAFEPPFVVDRSGHVPPADLDVRLHELIAADKRDKTVRFYMSKAMGVPWTMVTAMRVTPFWENLRATANSTAHDWAVMRPYMRGEKLRAADWSGVTVPTLVIAGADSAALLKNGAKAITAVLPDAEHRELAKLSHDPKIDILAPVAGEFLTRARR